MTHYRVKQLLEFEQVRRNDLLRLEQIVDDTIEEGEWSNGDMDELVQLINRLIDANAQLQAPPFVVPTGEQ